MLPDGGFLFENDDPGPVMRFREAQRACKSDDTAADHANIVDH
jgi:hypothetical protein